ncbi:MAG: T9SS type A sorting domain-containing protein [Saprospiraceae bacterium]|nr:T9SS type A sorting domain-containing protein [Saprospiraceae bacterium]
MDPQTIKKWVLYNLQGASLVQGSNWSTDLEIGNLHLGVYVLNIMDQNNCNYYFKFIKMK